MTTWDPLAVQNAENDVDPELAANALGELLTFFRDDTTSSPIENPATAPAPEQAETGASGEHMSPVPGGAPISGEFGEDRGDHSHGGVDLSVPVGTALIAAASGTVRAASNADPGGYGNMIEIQTDDGFTLRYAHMSTIGVKPGDRVRAGQVIGNSGGAPGAPGAGNSRGAHLHFEVRQGDKAIDPTPFLAGGYQIIGGVSDTGETSTADPAAIAAVQLQNVLNVLGGKPMVEEPSTTTSTTPTQSGEAGTDPDQWIRQAMAATGVDESWFGPLKARMMQESGGRNIPQGIVDVNTQKGTPAFGPMQVIEPTFRAHAMKGHEDWRNPVDNTIAAINYIKSRYGHPSKLPKGGY